MGNTVSWIYTNNLEDQMKSLQEQLDQNKDNQVTKEEFEEYLSSLSDRVDRNSDGIISKTEIEFYVSEQLQLSLEETKKWKNAYEKLQEDYDKLEDKLRSVQNGKPNEIKISKISTQALKDYIEEEIIRSDSNLKYVPDPIERKVYLTIYKTIMKTLERLFRSTSIDLINHKISFSIEPITK